MSASRNPDFSLIFLGLYQPLGVNVEKLGMERPLKKTER
jgi:hypothetical protein